ncbi:hypothetical protein GF407_06970 [candidate division KSB1 bacterium]|nr:hypothetical protein [candidate division KSB1 bacterium]
MFVSSRCISIRDVDAFGRLSPCLMSCQGTFYQGRHTFMLSVRAKKQTRRTPCRNCDLYSASVPAGFVCNMAIPKLRLSQVTHLRVEMMGLIPQIENSEKVDDRAPERTGNQVWRAYIMKGKKITNQTGKKPYSKPTLQKVELKSEEVVLAACKLSFGLISGPLQSGYCGPLLACKEIGS